MPKGKITKKLKKITPIMWVKMVGHTTPKFAHNAIAAGKDVKWSYEFWPDSDPSNVGSFDLEVDLNKFKKMNENKQSQTMNDDAIDFVKGNYDEYEVKLTSR